MYSLGLLGLGLVVGYALYKHLSGVANVEEEFYWAGHRYGYESGYRDGYWDGYNKGR